MAGDPDNEAVEACWSEARQAVEDPRRLVLMRLVGGTDPTRVYAGRIPASISAAEVPVFFRQRWQHQEQRIREMIDGANLNANVGYTYSQTKPGSFSPSRVFKAPGTPTPSNIPTQGR